MVTIAEVEHLASGLPENDRAVLAAHLLESLRPVLFDEDDGLAEALRRDVELEGDVQLGMSLEQFDQKVRARKA